MAEEFPFRYVPPVDPNLDRRFGRYIVRTLLGRGGMGAAYLAEHEARAHVKCVIKFVLAELAQNPMVISRYRTETEAVSLLKHDNIVRLLDFGVLDDGQLFMCFEYIDGKSLDRYVAERGGRLDIRKAAYFIFQLCDALEYVHERGVVHRDLKPDNLMIEASPRGSHLEERVKILDFGIAKVADTSEHTGSGISMGTPRYMAPEQVTNAASATSAADVFSLATIFYLVVTGQLPWGTPESDVAIYHLQKTEAPAWPTEDVMPHDVAAVVMRALSIKPALRPSMREFAMEIAAAIPREGALKSGTEILERVKEAWVTSSPPHAQTLPRPVAADPTVSEVPSQLASIAIGDAAAQVSDASAAVQQAEISPSVTDLAITANVRRRARVAAVLPALDAVPVGDASAERFERPPTPVLAALPTGLLSQRFTAQEPPIESRESRQESIVVASEIEMASGTPGPQPYAHAELPAVLVSNTQLSAAPSDARRPAQAPESPPFIVLPDAAQGAPSTARTRTRLVLLGLSACSFAAIVVVLVAQLGFHPSARGSAQTDALEGASRSAGSVAVAPPNVGPPEHAASASPGLAGSAVNEPATAPDPASRAERSSDPPSPGTTADSAPETKASEGTQVATAPGPGQARPKPPGTPMEATPLTIRPVSPPRAPAQASDDPMNGRAGATSSRTVPGTPPRLADQGASPNRSAPSQSRAPIDLASDVTLIIRVKGFATVSIDGDEPKPSPRRKRVPPGAHHVVMSGYPDGSEQKQTREFDVNAPAGRDETIIHKSW